MISTRATSPTPARRHARRAAMALTLAALASLAGPASAERSSSTLVCNQGPPGQRFDVGVSLPARAPAGSVFTVRIDGTSSGKISHFGLNYLHDMTVDYTLPRGASFVEARLVPGTGTANVLPGARLWHHDGTVTLALSSHVDEGTAYTPPSILLTLRAVGEPGSSASIGLQRFRLKANAFLVGDVGVACEPASKPALLGTTIITEPPPS
jgi:hypothetical protein